MSNNALVVMTEKLAARLDMGVDGSSLIDTLKATAFKGQVTDAQMVALLVVANQYGLNPWTKELYAFPDRNNGIIPVVGVDGWSRIINSNPDFDGMDFKQDDASCTCIIYRKDRGHPIQVTEYMDECKRSGAGPWQTHPKRMLRHKAMIQCARIAFGYVGIYDPDEAERISEGEKPQTKQAEAVVLINEAQAKQIREALTAAGKSEEAFCTKARIASVEELEAGRFDAAMALIGKAATQEAA
jgi:phage recombination protein Bet